MKDKKKRILILGALTTLVLACVLLIVLNSCSSCNGEHSWGEWEVLEEATCAQKGEQAHTCRRCHKTESESIPTFEHEPVSTLDSGETRHWNACKACDAKCNAEYHEYGEWEVAEEATCEKDGSRKRVCKVCKHEDVEVIPALGHTASEGWSKDKNKHYHTCTVCGGRVKVEIHQYEKMETVKKATNGEDGLQTGTCTVCGYHGSKVLKRTGASSLNYTGKHSVTVGGTLQLSATVSPDSVTDKTVTWSSLNKDVATVTKDGKLTAHKLGRVKVVATAANGYEEVFSVYVTETAIDGNINDKCYGKAEPFNWMDRDYNIGENISIYMGKDGLYLADRVSDDQVQGNGDTSRVETFITLSDVFSMTDTFVVRYYPNGYSKTGSTIRVFEYENASSKYRFRELEAKNKDLPDISAVVKYTDGGYDIEAFIPWSMFELTKAPAKIYYQSVGCARYGTSSGMKYATYEEDLKKYTESGIYDIENYIAYDKKGFVYDEIFLDKETIVMGNESIVDGAYTTEFYMHKLNDLNPLTGAKFSGTGSKYIKELGNGYYRLEVPVSAKASFEEAQTITIVDTRKLGEKFTLRIFDGTLVDDLAITYGGVENAPVLYGTNGSLDMSRFAATTEENANLDYNWTLTYNGTELTDVDMTKEYAFTKAGEYVLTADITTEGYEGSASMVIYVMTPDVYVNYEGGQIVNSGTDQSMTVGAYKLDKTPNSTKFVETTDVKYTTGVNGDKKGAISMQHNTGAYTVVKEYKFGTNDFTIATWFNVPTDSGNVSGGSGTYLFGNSHPDAKDGFSICLKAGEIRFRVNGSNADPAPKITYTKGTWNNVALSREGDVLKLYFNGTLVNKTKLSADYSFGTKDLAFGGYYGNPNNYHGNKMYFDDVQIYGKVLTEEQLQTIAGIDEIPAVEVVIDPEVKITYKGGKITNEGTDTSLTVGAYKLDKTPNSTKFEKATNATYVTGMDGDKNGALSMKHNTGAYTVVKDYGFGTNDFTISTWFNVPTSSANVSGGSGTYLFGNSQPDETASGTFSICLKSNQIRFRVNGSNETPAISYTKGTWNNMVLCREGDTLKLYFNGVLASEVILPTGSDLGTKDLAFGAYTNNPNNYHGNDMYYDNILVYGDSLSDEYIKENIVDGTNLIAGPLVDITYTDGKITNAGTGSALKVGAYKPNVEGKFTEFIGLKNEDVTYVMGMDGDAKGALSMQHTKGAYTVVEDYQFGTKDFTISTWFNVPTSTQDVSTGAGTYLFGNSQPDETGSGFSICLKKDQIRFRVNGSNATPKITYTKGTWNNMVLCREGTDLKLYFNGTLVNTTAISADYDFGTKDLAFGGYYGNKNNYHANVMYYDNILVYGDALTDEFIKENIVEGTNLVPSPVIDITYAGGKITNAGTGSTLTVGAYGPNVEGKFTEFVKKTDAIYVKGMDGDANGALSMQHTKGAYTVVEDYQFGTKDFTISTWFNVPTSTQDVSTGAGTYLFGNSQPDETGSGFSICLKKDQIRFRVNGSNATPKITYTKGTWNNMVLCREGTDLKLYFNGTLVNTTAISADYDFGTKDLAFGGYYGNKSNYHANVMYYDNILVYGDALTDEFIKNNIFDGTSRMDGPIINITFTDGKITNSGTNSTLKVGAYKLNANNDGFDTSTAASYTTGMGGDKNGALRLIHNLNNENAGAYTVIKDYEFGKKDFTISTWFNVPAKDAAGGDNNVSSGSNTYLFGISDPDAGSGFAVCLKSNVIRFRVNGKNKMPSITYAKGTWNNIVLCREGANLKLYFNGTLVNTTSISADYDFGTKDLAFGGYYGFKNSNGDQINYQGNTMYYDNIQMYSDALNTELINNLYSNLK